MLIHTFETFGLYSENILYITINQKDRIDGETVKNGTGICGVIT